MFPVKKGKDNESLSDSRLAMSHVWVKVGQCEYERIQVWDGYGVQPDFNLTCLYVHGRISRQWAYNLQSSFKWRTLVIALIQLFPNGKSTYACKRCEIRVCGDTFSPGVIYLPIVGQDLI